MCIKLPGLKEEFLSLTQNSKRRPLNEAEIRALQDFALLRIPLDELRAQLKDVLRIEFAGNVRKFDFMFDDSRPPVVLVGRKHLERALEQRRLQLISEAELSEWASVLLLVDAYGFVPKDEEVVVQWLNDLSHGMDAGTE